jgi:DNA-binding FrmR family transcriptional regulator
MRDEACADVLKRLACVRGHIEAIGRMIERGEDDLAVAHQLLAVQRALDKVQVRILRARCPQISERLEHSSNRPQVEHDLREIFGTRQTRSSPGEILAIDENS